MKGLLLRIGIDKGSGGDLAPIFEDGSFEYIPIPEIWATSEREVYANMYGRIRKDKLLSKYVPEKIRYSHPHHDPEFDTFTYGDPTKKKRKPLSELHPGDLLIFYAGLTPYDGLKPQKDGESRLYVIGYFDVEKVYDFENKKIIDCDSIKKITDCESVFKELRGNAHSKRYFGLKELVHYSDNALVIVKGKSENSKLLPKAIPLGDVGNSIMLDLRPMSGYEGSLLRAVGHKVDEKHIQKVKKWLNNGVSVLVDKNTHFFSYVLASDTGFAPNVTDGYCTLACCKPKIRSTARVGDWVMGTLPKNRGRNKLGYIMRINEALSFDEFFNDPRFKNKKPSEDPLGDNIYYKKEGVFVRVKNKHHKEKDLYHDTQADRVLISSLFWYFRDKAPEIPSEPSKFIPLLIKTGSYHKRIKDTDVVREFVSWVSSNYRPGVHGNPRDGYNNGS